MDYTRIPDISIHAPREGGDATTATHAHARSYFNPRPPRGGRHFSTVASMVFDIFQSTPPARGATEGDVRDNRTNGISIHAPREGGDDYLGVPIGKIRISIHAPREGGDLIRPILSPL